MIGIDISQIVYETGVSRYTKELVRHLLRIDQENEYLLFAGVWRQKEKIEAFFDELHQQGLNFQSQVVLLPPKLADLVFNQWRVPVEWFTGRIDVFHASNWTTPKTSAKLVTTIHDLTPILFPETFPPNLIKSFQRNLQLIEKTAVAVLVDCETIKKDLLQHTEIPVGKIYPVYLAAGHQFQPVKDKVKIAKVKQKYGIVGDYILSVATQEPRKNIKRLIEAFSQLNLNDISLVLVGKYGWGEKTKLKINPPAGGEKLKIIETGFVDDQDLPVLYSGARVFVYPSLYEGFGLPVLEAMQCGCPVIISNRSATAEISGEAALLIDPTGTSTLTQAIKQILADKKLREEMVRKGIKRAGQFNWRKTALETLAIYRKVIDASGYPS